MSDASEHLARSPTCRGHARGPVADEPAGRIPSQSERLSRRAIVDRPERVELGAHDRSRRATRLEQRPAPRRASPLEVHRRRRRPRRDRSERDERIDRLVVSRLRRSALSVAEASAVLAEHGLDEAEVEDVDRALRARG